MIKFSFFLLLVSTIFYDESLFAQSIPLTADNLELLNATAEQTLYKGKKATRIIATKERNDKMAFIKGVEFTNGTIELEVSGKPLPDADSTARGFIGLAFRIQRGDSLQYEIIYIRPTNGRSSDQLRRNHTIQYTSEPGFPWFKLRKETPGLYESYADMVPGEWTKLKIVVRDRNARLFVNGASQPCLIVNDLKKGISTGGIALWPSSDTDAYFRDLKITKQ